MSVFGGYAKYYDLLYRDKDYSAEVDFVYSIINQYCPNVETVLELGCGTGGHATSLAKKGLRIHGVDVSETMLDMAKDRHGEMPEKERAQLTFQKGDARSLHLGKKFDVVLSLFHVVSYQTSNEDVLNTFKTAKEHLREGGIFLFDFWYGPGVLTERPEPREKKLSGEGIEVMRHAEPVMHANDNVVDVNYSIKVTELGTAKTESFSECHRMRYFFQPEIEYFLENAGLQLVNSGEWMTGGEPGFNSWAVYCVAR